MNNSPQTWQILLCQAFQVTQITTNSKGICNLLNTRRFVYHSLQNAGIQNRSPFSISQLIKIWYHSKGKPEQIRSRCIDTVNSMQKPAFGFSSNAAYGILATIFLSLIMLFTPQTATTSKSIKTSESILQIMTFPWQDIETENPSLPSTTDYQVAAFNTEPTTEQKQLESMAAASWILDQRDSSYTLQLLSVSKKSNLISFCKLHKICDQSAIYTTQVNGQQLVRLIYGSYPNHNAAKLAKNHLPASLKNNTPWTRSFKQIKQEI